MDMNGRWFVAATAALTFGTACATASPDLSSPNPDDVIFRMGFAGGFVPATYAFGQVPTFTLYGDGRILTEGPQIEIYPPPALPNLLVRDATDEAVRRIVARAREAGLQGEDRSYTASNIADAHTTTFTLAADGDEHTTRVYALGEDAPPGASAAEREARARLLALQADLFDLRRWIPASELSDDRGYEAHAYRILATDPSDQDAPDDDLVQAPKDWPLAEPLAAFGQPWDVGRCGVVEGADLEALLAEAREASTLTPWISEGERYLITFRPLLPDETGC